MATKKLSVHPRDITRIYRIAVSIVGDGKTMPLPTTVRQLAEDAAAALVTIRTIAKRLNAATGRRDGRKRVVKKAAAKKAAGYAPRKTYLR